MPPVSSNDLETCRSQSERFVPVVNATEGFLPGALFPIACAVRISAQKGQSLRVFMYDFTLGDHSTRRTRNDATQDCPQFYLEIIERATPDVTTERETHRRCPQHQRVIYTSVGHVIDVRIHDVIDARAKFIFEYLGKDMLLDLLQLFNSFYF